MFGVGENILSCSLQMYLLFGCSLLLEIFHSDQICYMIPHHKDENVLGVCLQMKMFWACACRSKCFGSAFTVQCVLGVCFHSSSVF